MAACCTHRLLLLLPLFVAAGWSMDRLAGAKIAVKDGEDNVATLQKADAPKSAIKPGTGTIRGKIVLDGEMPKYERIKEILNYPACAGCDIPKGKEYWHADQKWIVGKDRGVANVLVRLKVPPGSYFETSDADKKRAAKEKIVMDMPCCAFDPHVVVLFPYFKKSGQEPEKTGQVLSLNNSGTLLHSAHMRGDQRLENEFNRIIRPGIESTFTFRPQSAPIDVTSNTHPFMYAKIFVYDHPYAVVTKDDGLFELKNVNIGTKLTMEFWHEAKDIFKTDEITLSEKEPTKNHGEVKLTR